MRNTSLHGAGKALPLSLGELRRGLPVLQERLLSNQQRKFIRRAYKKNRKGETPDRSYETSYPIWSLSQCQASRLQAAGCSRTDTTSLFMNGVVVVQTNAENLHLAAIHLLRAHGIHAKRSTTLKHEQKRLGTWTQMLGCRIGFRVNPVSGTKSRLALYANFPNAELSASRLGARMDWT